jgi:hypothetical protein
MKVNKIATQDAWDCQAGRYIEAYAPYQPIHLNVEMNNTLAGIRRPLALVILGKGRPGIR